MPLGKGDKVLVGETEFLGLAVPWTRRREIDGFQIEVVPCADGRVRIDDFAHAVDAHTRLILLSSVQWNNGYRADLAAFSELARSRGIILVVDAIQQLGAMPLNVGQTPIDFLVCGGHKWLNAPVGRGFLYVNPKLDRLRPPTWGYLGIAEPPQGWAEYFATPNIPAVRSYDFLADARRFEVGGTANYPGNVALGASVALLNELGSEAIEQHILQLTDLLMDGLRSAGATLVSAPEPAVRSGIVTFTLGHGPLRDQECLHRFWDRRILISQRYTAGIGGLRASVHCFNNAEDVQQLLGAVSPLAASALGAKPQAAKYRASRMESGPDLCRQFSRAVGFAQEAEHAVLYGFRHLLGRITAGEQHPDLRVDLPEPGARCRGRRSPASSGPE